MVKYNCDDEEEYLIVCVERGAGCCKALTEIKEGCLWACQRPLPSVNGQSANYC